MKPSKIKLKVGDTQGMYILLNDNELLNKREYTTAPSRDYKIQIAVEAMYNNKRCRGKKIYPIKKGISITKAIKSLFVKRQAMIDTLKARGTLKQTKDIKINLESRIFSDCWLRFTLIRKIELKESTIKNYQETYERFLSPLYKKQIDDISINDIQSIVNDMIKKEYSPSFISKIKSVTKPILDHHDVILNWKKLKEPEIDNFRKYKKSIQETKKIIEALKGYSNKEINAIFKFSLTGRRIGEILSIRYEDINWNKNTYTILKENTKGKKELEYHLTDDLINAIKSRGAIKESGKLFSVTSRVVYSHFKKCMNTINITDMTQHDLRAMVAQTALDNGASIYDVSTMLAHATITITQKRYVAGKAEHATNALNKFDEAMQGVE